jgi:hypothetical protein
MGAAFHRVVDRAQHLSLKKRETLCESSAETLMLTGACTCGDAPAPV